MQENYGTIAVIMSEQLSQKKHEKIDDLVDDAKDAASEGHNTENQLSNNLISVTLSFVALIATAISVSNVLYQINIQQKILIMTSISLFTVSIVTGLINYFVNMIFHQETARVSRKKARSVKVASTGDEVTSVVRPELSTRSAKANWRNNALILAQMLLLVVGLVCCVVFIGTLLFITGG